MKDNITPELLNKEHLPKHIAIIMDGNGRWAKKRGLQRILGHRKGVETFETIVNGCRELGIEYLTVYAFSTENWKRPAEEVGALMSLLVEFVEKKLAEINRTGIWIHHIGTFDGVDGFVREKLEYAEKVTENNDKMVLNFAFNYGSREEILQAVKRIARDVNGDEEKIAAINEEMFSAYLYTAGQPEPDLLIRTSGELRLSNFLLWQIAYTEIWVSDVLWPDFGKQELWQAIYDYQKRSRRFGGLEGK